MSEQFIWLGVYEHRHGTDISVYATEAAAQAGREAVAHEMWENELPDEPMPDTDVADAYFDLMAERGEWFEIRVVPVLR
jgi:hypothetical protein